ncbi:MAG: signal peptidase II [Pseudomonadales bacterium]|jgi:signal peptidase II|nr:signal peptidase II [Pseudomonadales bacterium]
MNPRTNSGMLAWAWLGALIALLDQGTKALVEALLPLGARVDVLPVFAWVHVLNEGAAFSFLADADGWQRWFFAALAVAFSAWLLYELTRLKRSEHVLAIAYALVLGGALGNLVDRVLQGAVTDFVLVHWGGAYFPAFNLADSAITMGAMLWIGAALLEMSGHHRRPDDEHGPAERGDAP